MKVLFVGSNPSVSAKTLDPFCRSTKSGKILLSWIERTNQEFSYSMCNVSDNPTSKNKPLKIKEIKDNLDSLAIKIAAAKPDKIVALGKTASKALTLLRVAHYVMPHPSGLNRQLNDPSFIEQKINGLRNFILSP
jgi:uracil-DNA glycosylase